MLSKGVEGARRKRKISREMSRKLNVAFVSNETLYVACVWQRNGEKKCDEIWRK